MYGMYRGEIGVKSGSNCPYRVVIDPFF